MNWKRSALMIGVLLAVPAFAAGPLLVGGPNLGKDGQPFVWNTATLPIQYRVDAGPMSATIDNADALTRVRKMFDVWQNVPTANISYNYAGPVLDSTGQPLDVKTMQQFNQVVGACNNGSQSPVIFDADGSLLSALYSDDSIIGLSGPCKLDETVGAGFILSGLVVMNGKWIDGVSSNGELSAAEFNAAIVHELGHLSGMGHTQVNLQILLEGCSNSDIVAGLPLMFPFSVCEPVVDSSGFPILSPDDLSEISRLYPNAQTAASYGTITGTIFFPDGQSQAQGVNVIARRLDDPNTQQDESLRIAVSGVSGDRFTGNPGQDITGDNAVGDLSGSRNPQLIGRYEIMVPPGTYTIEIESIFTAFTGGSSVTPLDPPVPISGLPEFWNQNESAFDIPGQSDTLTVGAGQTIQNIDIIQNSSFRGRFDQFEDGAHLDSPLLSPFQPLVEVQA